MQDTQQLSVVVELTQLLQLEHSSTLALYEGVSATARALTHSERASLYLYNPSKQTLITKVAHGVTEDISIALGEGLAGMCGKQNCAIIENNTQNNPNFKKSIDAQTGYTTHRLLAVPINSEEGTLLGVLQVLNKSQDYNQDDQNTLELVAQIVAHVISSIDAKEELQNRLVEKTRALEDLNSTLQEKVNDQVRINREKDSMMFKQAKLASMGEMMDAITHQWKQPLCVLSTYTMQLMMMDESDCKVQSVQDFAKKLDIQIEHLNSTINEFHSFFRPNKRVDYFSIKHSIDSVLELLHDELQNNTITVEVHVDKDVKLYGIENEFKHVLINILNNAKDAFKTNQIKDKKVKITTQLSGNHLSLSIIDNAGGIPTHIKDRIFEANVSSKPDNEGSGIGLYISAMIVDKMHGSIAVTSSRPHSTFTLSFPFYH